MFSFLKIREYIMKFIKPSLYIGGIDYVLKVWHEANAKERGILLLTFSPMFVSFGGLIATIVYFVLFVLPSYVFSAFGWGLLTALFGAGGKYCYKYFTGKNISGKAKDDIIDVQYTEELKEEQEEEEEPEPEPKPQTERKTAKRRTPAKDE